LFLLIDPLDYDFLIKSGNIKFWKRFLLKKKKPKIISAQPNCHLTLLLLFMLFVFSSCKSKKTTGLFLAISHTP